MNIPIPNVKYVSSEEDSLDVEALRGIFCNPIYTGISPYPGIMSDEDWIKAAIKVVEEDGLEQFLVNMLYMLRMSMSAANSDLDDTDIHNT